MANGRLAWDFKGLVTAPGLLARPGASCLVANNWRFPAPGIARKREGFERVSTFASNQLVSSLIRALFIGRNYLAAIGSNETTIGTSYATVVACLSSGASPGGTTGEDMGPGASTGFATPSGESFARNGYMLFPRGTICRYETGSTTILSNAGMPRGRAPLVYSMNAATFSVLTAGTLLANNASRAYRVTWHRRTLAPTTGADDSVELGGPPTARLVIRNIAGTSGFTGATMDVQLRIPLARQLDLASSAPTTDWFWRLWGSRIETSATATPDDEMYLVAEAFLTSTDIANGYASVTDNTPDIYLESSPRLNTNATNFPPLEAGLLNGQANADERPPNGRCMASFAGCLFVGAPVEWPEQTFRLVSLPAPGESFTVYGLTSTVTLTAVAGAPAATTDFTVVTTLATLGLNLEATARNIADALTLSALAPQACHVSLGTDAQGSIRFSDFGSEFWVYSASATTRARFSPQLQASTLVPGIRPTSAPNSLAFSKPNRPDSFPSLNRIVIGGASNVVRSLLAFRERLLVFTDEGLYAVDGSSFADFTVTPVDLTAKLLCRRSVVSLDDAAFAWCVDGIIEYRNGAIRRISEPIAPTMKAVVDLFASFGSQREGIDVGFAVSDPRNHEVQFWYASRAQGALGPRNTRWLAWNTMTEQWSTGSRPAETQEEWIAHALAYPDGTLGLLGARTSYVTGDTSVAASLLTQSYGYDVNGTPTATKFADDYNVASGEVAVSSELRLQWALADADARVHWQRTVLEFEDGEQSFLLKPTALSLVWRADAQGAASSVVTLAPTTPLVEAEVPDGYRRATRSQLTITHSAKEPCGLIAVKQTFAGGGSRFPG